MIFAWYFHLVFLFFLDNTNWLPTSLLFLWLFLLLQWWLRVYLAEHILGKSLQQLHPLLCLKANPSDSKFLSIRFRTNVDHSSVGIKKRNSQFLKLFYVVFICFHYFHFFFRIYWYFLSQVKNMDRFLLHKMETTAQPRIFDTNILVQSYLYLFNLPLDPSNKNFLKWSPRLKIFDSSNIVQKLSDQFSRINFVLLILNSK